MPAVNAAVPLVKVSIFCGKKYNLFELLPKNLEENQGTAMTRSASLHWKIMSLLCEVLCELSVEMIANIYFSCIMVIDLHGGVLLETKTVDGPAVCMVLFSLKLWDRKWQASLQCCGPSIVIKSRCISTCTIADRKSRQWQNPLPYVTEATTD